MTAASIGGEGHIGRYRLVKRLAVGGMADIWLAQEFGKRGYDRTVVVKTIRADLVDEDELIQMLVEEARIASCLEHDNIVELHEVGEEDGTHFLAMEFVFGRDLRQVRDHVLELGESVPFEHIVTIVSSVLNALHYAYHDATFEGRPLRVIHRDVSPQNVIIGFDGSVKLLDFGIAKAAAQLSRTRAGVLKGKYGYMAPEQVDFKDLDQRADVFSTGIVLWEMLTMKRLFYRSSEYETVQAVLKCQVPFPKSAERAIPFRLAWIAYRALRRGARWRFQDGRAMASALLAWDKRSPEVAQDELAGWMGELYGDDLRKRDDALIRVRNEPARFRQIQDAGFELVEEETRRDRVPRAPRPMMPAERPRRLPITTDIPLPRRGMMRLVAATVGTWKWFLMLLGALVVLGLSTGIYIASLQTPVATYGYLSVRATSPQVEVIIGGHRVGKAPVDNVVVLPGRHRVVGVLGDAKQTIEVVVTAGGRQVVELDLPQRAPPR